MAMPTADASWRDSARYPKLFFLDARAVFPLIAFLLHIKLWTFIIAMIFTVFFSVLMRFGFTISVFRRFIRAYVGGKRKTAKPWWAYGYR
jgi:intracellular multiplication protein IcmT